MARSPGDRVLAPPESNELAGESGAKGRVSDDDDPSVLLGELRQPLRCRASPLLLAARAAANEQANANREGPTAERKTDRP